MNVAHVTIAGGDYSNAGKGSKEIKDELRRIGVTPETIRRAIVAVYEGEMNVAIHAFQGELRATITPETLEVVIEDSGPGIPDIEQAMREGFSTAPPEARELGFGAGMGLPNIRRNADRFTIKSEVGKGTTLKFSVFLKPDTTERMNATAVRVDPGKCIRCLQCLSVCPTQAIRLHGGGPEIIRHLCVDCTSCKEICPQGVFDMECDHDFPVPSESSVLVLSDEILGQCGPFMSLESIETALSEAGWTNLAFSNAAEGASADAALTFVKQRDPSAFFLAPVCPAVVNLIRLRYPALIKHILPFLTPIEIIRDSLSDDNAVFIPSCPAQSALVRDAHDSSRFCRVHPARVKRILLACAQQNETPVLKGEKEPLFPGLAITGMKRVCQFLEKAERNQMNDCGLVALYACDQGCYGSPFWDTPPMVAMARAKLLKPEHASTRITALRRIKALEPRSGARLDPDMSKAIEKLARMDRLSKQLPGRNCGVCGAPTCLTLAEDVVMGRAALASCIFMENAPEEPGTGEENTVEPVNPDAATGTGKPDAGNRA